MTIAASPVLLTLPTIAKRWAVSVRTIRRLIVQGELPAHRIGNSVRVPIDEVYRYERKSRI